MDEDWELESGITESAPAVPSISGNVPKLRGFGRGMPVNGTTGAANGVGGGFGRPSGFESSKDDDDAWDGNTPPAVSRGGGGFGAMGSSFGGSGRGGGSGCRKCGEEGHFARDCPNGSGSSHSGGGRNCHKCGEEGHFARECPSGGGGRGGGRAGGAGGGKGCHKCGEEGHFARECPNSDGASSGSRFGSGRGGFRGNSSRSNGDAFERKGGFGDGGARRGGFGGGERGGFRKFGSQEAVGDGFGNQNSNRSGFGRNRGGFGDGGDSQSSGKSGCRKCGEGHFARECPNGGRGEEKSQEKYVPPTVDEESLFKEGIHQGINFDKYDNIDVEVTGNNRVRPIMAFDNAGLLPTFLKNVHRAGYTKPTPIQKHAIPAILAGRDLMGCAQTGSGKTAAFILPVLTAMVNQGLTTGSLGEGQEPQTLIIAPTRELASQIYMEARKFAARSDVRPVVVYGGVAVNHQLKQIQNGANMVVGTPGRLLDFIEKGAISLRKVKFLILDEADRMLDMGFEPSIRKMVETLGMPPKRERQTLMFSATFKAEIQHLAADFMNDYLFITVGIVGGACSDVEQMFLEVDRLQKREYLCDLLNAAGTDRVLVFVGQKRNADFLASFLSQSGYPTTTIHGDRLQREREEALLDFKKGRSTVLIATNVAARGLDIPDVTHVINYDLPSDIDEYVHRIGRTGRCGNLGKATSFYNNDTDSALASSLVKILSEARQEVPDWLADHAASGGGGEGGRFSGRFASKDIRRKKFDNAEDFSKSSDYNGGDSGGANTANVYEEDEEEWC